MDSDGVLAKIEATPTHPSGCSGPGWTFSEQVFMNFTLKPGMVVRGREASRMNRLPDDE
jgi:hypothetical protein